MLNTQSSKAPVFRHINTSALNPAALNQQVILYALRVQGQEFFRREQYSAICWNKLHDEDSSDSNFNFFQSSVASK